MSNLFDVFKKSESEVRSYCRNFPILFDKALNAEMYSTDGKRYIDFFSGAGALNYGHNNPYVKDKVLNYLSEDKIVHALDMYTVAKEEFLLSFNKLILESRNLDYKIMCCGSTGANAVEAALKLARKNTRRTGIIAFHGAFHGMSLGSLSCTTDRYARAGAGISMHDVSFMPYSNGLDSWEQSLNYLEWILSNDHSGVSLPAAIILETVQAEGGINIAENEWLKGIRNLCNKYGILMICDDIQVGNGRTGSFFSFERAGVIPDLVCLSKSISGFGLPMSLLLIKPEFDIFGPAEHNGTWRGNQLAFVGAKAGIEYFCQYKITEQVKEKGNIIENFLKKEIQALDARLEIRGIGMIWGIDFSKIEILSSKAVMQECVRQCLIIERAGAGDCVLKIMPPLTIDCDTLNEGLTIIKTSLKSLL